MIISIIQPCFVPWLGYFEQIALADLFVYMDDVQYTKKDWRNVNNFKTPYGIKKISVPVIKTSRSTLLFDIDISNSSNWHESALNKLVEWYNKSPYFSEIITFVEKEFSADHRKLTDLVYNLNKSVIDYLDIKTPIYFSSEVEKNAKGKNERIIEICQYYKANVLYDGKSAQNFIDIQLFKENGIEVVFQNYIHKPYSQLWGKFEPYLSVLDLLLNCGKKSLSIILSSPVNSKLISNDN